MSRRIPMSRRPSIESLEARCNPSAGAGLPNVPVVDLQLDQKYETLATHEVGHILGGPTSDASAAGKVDNDRFADIVTSAPPLPPLPMGDGGVDVVTGGSGQDVLLGGDERNTLERTGIHELGHWQGLSHTIPTSEAAGTGDVNSDGFDDIIVGATINGHVKAFDGSSGAEIRSFFAFEGFAGGVSVGAADHTAVSGKITSIAVDESDPTGGNGSGGGVGGGSVFYHLLPSTAELESIIDDLARDVASQSEPRSSFPGFTGGVYVAAGDVNGGGIDDIISDTDGDELASGYIKVKKLTSGG